MDALRGRRAPRSPQRDDCCKAGARLSLIGGGGQCVLSGKGEILIEVELKYEVPRESQRRVQEYLRQTIFRGVVENRDTYYDTSTFTLLQQAVFVRVRNQI